MVHGAWLTGVRAAQSCADGERVAVVGAGMAGLSAAAALHERDQDVVVLEARDRIGGRVHTVELDGVRADAGGAWLQQRSRNPLVERCLALGLHLVPTDFASPLSGAHDGPAGDVDHALTKLIEVVHAGADRDAPLSTVLDPYLHRVAGERSSARRARRRGRDRSRGRRAPH